MAFAVIISNCAATEGRGSNFSKLEARPRPPWGRMDRVRSIAVLFLLSQVLGLVFNEWVYADMFRRSDVLARQIATEVGASSAPDIASSLVCPVSRTEFSISDLRFSYAFGTSYQTHWSAYVQPNRPRSVRR